MPEALGALDGVPSRHPALRGGPRARRAPGTRPPRPGGGPRPHRRGPREPRVLPGARAAAVGEASGARPAERARGLRPDAEVLLRWRRPRAHRPDGRRQPAPGGHGSPGAPRRAGPVARLHAPALPNPRSPSQGARPDRGLRPRAVRRDRGGGDDGAATPDNATLHELCDVLIANFPPEHRLHNGALLVKAAAYLNALDLERARDWTTRAIEANVEENRRLTAAAQLGLIALQEGRFDEALDRIEAAILTTEGSSREDRHRNLASCTDGGASRSSRRATCQERSRRARRPFRRAPRSGCSTRFSPRRSDSRSWPRAGTPKESQSLGTRCARPSGRG